VLPLRTLIKRTALSGILVAAACHSSRIVGPHDFARFSQARARWDARPFADYSYEIRTSCFCPPEINRWARVSVRNGVVVDVDPVEPDPNFPITTLLWWHPIDSVFANLYRAMSESRMESYFEAIVVDYDSALGYPTSIEYRAKSNIADGGSSLSLRDVRPLE
jgi:hypothetical protein